jgi:hypothetical protein
METEQAFLAALAQVRSWKILGQHLELLDASGNLLTRFQARDMKQRDTCNPKERSVADGTG